MTVPGDWTCEYCLGGRCKMCLAANGYIWPTDEPHVYTKCLCHLAGHDEETRAWHDAGRLTRHDA